LRRQFLAAFTATFALAAIVVAVSTFMSFPDRHVTTASVLLMLLAPVLLLASTAWTYVAYRWLLQRFRQAWQSPAYSDDAIWLEFHPVVPRWAMPAYLRTRLAKSLPRDVGTTLLLALAFWSGPIASFDAFFNEVAVWEYAVGWHATLAPDGAATSLYVDRGHDNQGRARWPLGLQSPASIEALQRHPEDLVYVHAHGKFCRPLDEPADQRFRCNLGIPRDPRVRRRGNLATSRALIGSGSLIVGFAAFLGREPSVTAT
jgi:hypothetical protein